MYHDNAFVLKQTHLCLFIFKSGTIDDFNKDNVNVNK